MIKLKEIEACTSMAVQIGLERKWKKQRGFDVSTCYTRDVMRYIEQLEQALEFMMEEKIDYMIINNLGNPETTHSVQLARAALKKHKEP